MRKTIFLIAVLCLCFMSPVKAAGFVFNVSTTFEVLDNSSVRATYDVSVTNETAQPTPSSIDLPLVGDAKSISAKYSDGKKISYEVSEQTVTLKANQDNKGLNNTWGFELTYITDNFYDFGKTSLLNVPVLDFGDLNISKHTIILSSDLDLGLGTVRGPEATSSDFVKGKQQFRWVKNGKFNRQVGLWMGDQAVAEVSFTKEIKNSSWWWQKQIVVLPPDNSQQQIIVDSISPTPSSVSLDIDGNIIASYTLRPLQKKTISYKVRALVNNVVYTAGDGDLTDLPEEVQKHTQTTDLWSGGETSIKDSESISKQLSSINTQVIKGKNVEPDYEARKALADKLVGEYRHHGFPARTVLGISRDIGLGIEDEALPHAWVEVYAPSFGWITVDPTLSINGQEFGSNDVTHIAIVIRGVNEDYPPELLSSTSSTYLSEDIVFPEISEANLSATNYVVLPGLSIQRINISIPAGTAIDGTAVSINGLTQKLGSLAPFQKVGINRVGFLKDAFSSLTVTFGIGEGQISNTIAVAQGPSNYMPMIGIIGLISLLSLTYYIFQKYHSKNTSKGKHAVVLTSEDKGEAIEDKNLAKDIEDNK